MEKIPKKSVTSKEGGATSEKAVFRLGVSPVEGNKKIGPIRTHLYNYAAAKGMLSNGVDSKVIFRVDDTNKKFESKEMAYNLLNFFSDELGFQIDITPENSENEIGQSVFQSERQSVYDFYVQMLFDEGVAFIEKDSGITLFNIEAFIKKFSDTIIVDDMINGSVFKKLESLLRNGQKYFPLCRSDGSALYHLASVVDDGSFGVTHVVRGQDKMSNAEYQEMVRIALGLQEKRYLHVPLLQNNTTYSQKFNDLIELGIMPQTLISYMISSGYGDSNELYPSLHDFSQSFDVKKIHKNSGQFDYKKLESINKKLIRELSPNVYIGSVLLLLSKKGSETIVKTLKESTEIQDYFLHRRSTPEEVFDILNALTNPLYETISEDLSKEADRIIVLYESNTNMGVVDMESKDQRLTYDALRWICTGKKSFPDINFFFNYLQNKNLLTQRVVSAKSVLCAEK